MTNHQDLKELLRTAEVVAPLPWAPFKDGGVPCINNALPESYVGSFDGSEERDLVLAAVNALPTLLDEREALVARLSRATDEEALARVILSAEGWTPEEVEGLARGGPTWNRALRIASAIIQHITEAPHG